MPELAPASVGNEITTLPMHGCTHIDALSHIGMGGWKLIAWRGQSKNCEQRRLFRSGAENFPPIILRGVLLDVAGSHGVEVLPDSYGITGADLKRCEESQGVTISESTAVLIRTGFSKYWRIDNSRFSNKGAGINLDGARYLAERKIALVGTDTEAVDSNLLIQKVLLPVHI
jgi:kynurenine formamidase